MAKEKMGETKKPEQIAPMAEHEKGADAAFKKESFQGAEEVYVGGPGAPEPGGFKKSY